MRISVCILAGGEGKRMNSTLPKVLHLFKSKPMIVHVIEKSFKLSPERIIIVTGRYNNLIQKTIKQFIEEKYYDKLIFVIQETPMGKGHAISCTLRNYNEDERVLILNGDTPNIRSNLLQKFTNRYESRLLISVIEEPAGYGRIIMNEKDEIQKIVE